MSGVCEGLGGEMRLAVSRLELSVLAGLPHRAAVSFSLIFSPGSLPTVRYLSFFVITRTVSHNTVLHARLTY